MRSGFCQELDARECSELPFRIVKRSVVLQWPNRTRSSDPEEVVRENDASRLGLEAPREIDLMPHGLLYEGDNLAALQSLVGTHREKVTLAYLDPPFLTQRVFEKKTRATKTVQASREAAFDDRWRDRAAYLEVIESRLTLIRDLLAPWGSVVIHVDPKTSHYIKVLADEIFGEDAFASEIVWRYRRWPAKTPNFQRVHDVLLRYRKDSTVQPRFNALYEPLAPSTLATWGTTKQRAVFGKNGTRVRSQSTEEETQGVPMGDVWEIGVIAPVAKERTGYPSQKPEALLERLVSALSSEGDWVLDPYAGSGTTLAVASRLGRKFVGMDASPVAHTTIRERLAHLFPEAPTADRPSEVRSRFRARQAPTKCVK
jgi:DNA modification methylase